MVTKQRVNQSRDYDYITEFERSHPVVLYQYKGILVNL
jgi:hypothetical protein